jgi:serine-type D-Ala-D-Ala carboxypeptidase/endopeptidase (penicillin-binding protein 4)
MKCKVLSLTLVAALWPVRANELSGGTPLVDTTPLAPLRLESAALMRSLARLERRRYRPQNQGVLVETLDGSKVLAEFNADAAFNPASVMKLGTSLMALAHLGPNHRFLTNVYADSELDTQRKTLPGNLYALSDGNPMFVRKDALALARSLVRRGMHRVEGDLVVAGPFCLDERFTTEKSAQQLRRAFTRIGITIKGKLRLESRSAFDITAKVLYLSHTSERLRDILWEQNAHSVNEIADRLGDLMGGPLALQQFLIENAGIEPREIYVDRASGLEYNRMTARAGVKLLRQLHYWLEAREMKLQDIMPVAGLDDGTLYGRFRDPDFRGGVLGKTGTNPSKDGGVSTLAGMMHTRDHGMVLYAIFNTHGSVKAYRRWQDNFLKDLIEECGGLGEYLEPHEDFADLSSSWTASEYWSSLPEEPTRRQVTRRVRTQPSRKYVRSRNVSRPRT